MPDDFMQHLEPKQRLEELVKLLEQSAYGEHWSFDVDKVYEEFCTILDSQLDIKCVNHKGISSRKKAWWNAELGAYAREVRQALKAWKLSKEDQQLKAAYLQKRNQFSKMVRSNKRKFRVMRSTKLLEEQKLNPKAFWKFIKNLGGSDGANLPETVTDEGGGGRLRTL